MTFRGLLYPSRASSLDLISFLLHPSPYLVLRPVLPQLLQAAGCPFHSRPVLSDLPGRVNGRVPCPLSYLHLLSLLWANSFTCLPSALSRASLLQEDLPDPSTPGWGAGPPQLSPLLSPTPAPLSLQEGTCEYVTGHSAK